MLHSTLTPYSTSILTPSPQQFKYQILHQHPSCFSYEDLQQHSLFSKLFQSFNPEQTEKLLNNTFGGDFIKEELEKINSGANPIFLEPEEFLWRLEYIIQQEAEIIYITSEETGEKLAEIPLTQENMEKSLEELLPSSSSDSFDLTAKGFRSPEDPDDYPDRDLSGDEYDDDEVIRFGAYFTTSRNQPGLTYKMNGIRHHRPPRDTLWSEMTIASLVTGWFVDAETRKVTDEFYGSCNDFNYWFLGNVGRKQKFFVFFNPKDGESDMQAHEVRTYINHECVVFRCNRHGEWREAS